MMSMMGGSMAIFNMIFWILILGFLIYGLILLILKPFEKKRGSSREESEAVNILQERFARGEIDRQEFEERKTILNSSND